MPLLTVLTPCYNEEENVRAVYEQVKAAMAAAPGWDYDHLFIDNASTDRTVAMLRELAGQDRRVKVIVNTRNFGHIRSPYHAFLQARGDAVIGVVADLQDPPALIPQFLAKWEEGYKVVIGVKSGSSEALAHGADPALLLLARRTHVVRRRARAQLHRLRPVRPGGRRAVPGHRRAVPYFRGLVSDFGYERAVIEYRQPPRVRGKTKNNFFSLYDIAMLGITNHSKVPLRLATMAGFAISILSLLVAFGYLVAKLLFWDVLELGLAPLLIGIYFFGAVQLFFIGMLGEYIGAIHTQVHKRPLVVEGSGSTSRRPGRLRRGTSGRPSRPTQHAAFRVSRRRTRSPRSMTRVRA